MSYYFSDKPATRFGDRLRSGNSGDDLMESLKRQFEQDSKTFFEPNTTPASAATPNNTTRGSRERETPFDHRHVGFSRGFPFDDDGFERRGNIRSHLDDLAARHPEFADQLLGPPWGDAPFLSTPRNRRRGSGLGSTYQNHPDDDTRSQASGSSAASAASGASGVSSHGEPEPFTTRQEPVQEQRKNHIPQYGLRNTVDIGQHRHNMDNNENEKMNRGQRSASAPPENRQTNPQQQQQQQFYEAQQHQQQQQQQPQNQNQRFVSRVDITPQQQQQQQDISKPPISPKQNQPQQSPPQSQIPQQQQKPQQHGNVRHIPIFVEGRDEPVVPKNVEEPVFPQQQQQQQRPQSPPQFHRPSHFNQHFANSRPQQQWPPQYQQQFYQQPQQHDQHTPAQQQTQKPNHYQQQQQQYRQQQAEKQRAQQQQQQQQEAEPAPKLKQIQPKEPLERVALVQQEVDSLMEQVKQYNGNSRQAKDYMYLDEMLTRELIKLDDIETEGKPEVRQARKNAIKSIQDCIAFLESKVPLPGQEETQETVVKEDEKTLAVMETDLTTNAAEPTGATEVTPQVIQATPIPLPFAPSLEQNSSNEESNNVQEGTVTEQSESTPLAKTPSDIIMDTQQQGYNNIEGQKRQAESSPASLIPDQQMDLENSSSSSSIKATKSPRKERKTIPQQKPVSEQPIPLPAPEVCHT